MQHCIAAEPAGDIGRRRRDGSGGIACHRLEQDGHENHAGFLRLLGRDEAVFGIGQHERRMIAQRIGDASQCILIEAFRGNQGEELLGSGGAGQWPETCSLSASKNYRKAQAVGHVLLTRYLQRLKAQLPICCNQPEIFCIFARLGLRAGPMNVL
jgi:hypothetical protein